MRLGKMIQLLMISLCSFSFVPLFISVFSKHDVDLQSELASDLSEAHEFPVFANINRVIVILQLFLVRIARTIAVK